MSMRAQLQAAWTQQATRIDALTVRERLFIFLTLAVLLLGLLDSLLIAPLSQEQTQQLAGLRKVESELQGLRQQYLLAGQVQGPNSPHALLQRELDAERARQAGLQRGLLAASAGAASGAAGSTPLASVLGTLLQAHPRLRLARLQTLEELPAGIRPPPGAWHLQGVELRVQGDYLELTNYMSELQQKLPGLRWGELRLTALGDGPANAMLQVQLVLASAP